MSQNHLSLDFPIKTPASARALNEELPPLMPNFAKVLDHLGTVHFSRFMVKGDEKLLFLSDVDGEIDKYIERLVESAGPLLDAIFKDRELIASQIANVAAAVFAYDHRNLHERRVKLDRFVILRNRLLASLLLCGYRQDQQHEGNPGHN